MVVGARRPTEAAIAVLEDASAPTRAFKLPIAYKYTISASQPSSKGAPKRSKGKADDAHKHIVSLWELSSNI